MQLHVFRPIDAARSATPQAARIATLDSLQAAEAQGYHGAWLAEPAGSAHGIDPSLHLATAWLAARTSRIRIGVAVELDASFHPLRLAEELASLDILSGGRFAWSPGGAEDSGDRLRSFDEQLAIIERAWTGEPFSFSGEFFEIPELRCLPAPVQQPRPPIWVSAASEPAARWAAARGWPILSPASLPNDVLGHHHAAHRAAADAPGQDDRPGHAVLRLVHVGRTSKQARDEAAAALLSVHRGSSAGRAAPEADPEALLVRLLDEVALVGDAARVRAGIDRLRERTRAETLVCWHGFGGLDPEAARASQQRFADEVAPALA